MKLTLWDDYGREDVHSIFSPGTSFTPQTGTWGLQGIVKVPDHSGSYVFFVTFGKHAGGYAFEESITSDGVLTWQSQPKQRLLDATIQELIAHDDRTASIHLFLRTRGDKPYTYCGVLGYLAHDEEREQPVHFQWQLLDWPAPESAIAKIGLELEPSATPAISASPAPLPAPAPVPMFQLDEIPPPAAAKPGGTKTKTFKAVKRAMHPDQDARNKALGLAGEELVLEVEKRRLLDAGRNDLAAKVTHVSIVEGDGAGYDVRSYSESGEVRHLEVKTTRSGEAAAFLVSPNEVAFSDAHPDTFVLVRVFHYDSKTKSGGCYRKGGSLTVGFSLEPSQYRAALQV